MTIEKPAYRTKSQSVAMKMNKEGQDSPKSSDAIAIQETSQTEIIGSKSLRIKKISNLFSKALNESRELRGQLLSLSQRELSVRFEEIIDITRVHCLKILEEENE